jgi:hypothetical protein
MKIRWSLIVGGFLIANAIFFIYFGVLRRSSATHFSYGEGFPYNSAVDYKGQRVDWDKRWALFIFSKIDSYEGIRNIKYANVLSRRFESADLAVVAFVAGSSRPQLQTLVESSGLSYPIVTDNDGTWGNRLALGEHPFGIFIVDPQGKIKFTSTHAEPDDLRQLIEKYLVGNIEYAPPGGVPPLKVGQKLPAVLLEDLRGHQQVRLEGLKDRVIVIFTARCPACSLETYLTSYRYLEKQLPKTSQIPLLIFSSKFSGKEITDTAGRLDIRAGLYMAHAGIPGVEDEYYAGGYFPNTDLVITTDGTGTVMRTESLEEAVNEARGKQNGEKD